MGGLIVDTSVFIAIERRGGVVDFSPWREHAPFAISAVTVSELLVGCHRAENEGRRRLREAFVQGVLSKVDVIAFDAAVAVTHAAIVADQVARGIPSGPHDLLIAATAKHFGRSILTANLREFTRVAGLNVFQFS